LFAVDINHIQSKYPSLVLPSNNIVNFYSIDSNCDKTVDVLSFEIDTSHIHYEPLEREIFSQECTVHCNHPTVSLNMMHTINCNTVTESPNPERTNNSKKTMMLNKWKNGDFIIDFHRVVGSPSKNVGSLTTN
jgi:hypothetical protein